MLLGVASLPGTIPVQPGGAVVQVTYGTPVESVHLDNRVGRSRGVTYQVGRVTGFGTDHEEDAILVLLLGG